MDVESMLHRDLRGTGHLLVRVQSGRMSIVRILVGELEGA